MSDRLTVASHGAPTSAACATATRTRYLVDRRARPVRGRRRHGRAPRRRGRERHRARGAARRGGRRACPSRDAIERRQRRRVRPSRRVRPRARAAWARRSPRRRSRPTARCSIGHVGDSRAYLVPRRRARASSPTDHSLVEELVRDGRLTAEQAAVHPQRSIITRALGVDSSVEVDVYPVELAARRPRRSSAPTASPTWCARTRSREHPGREADPTRAANAPRRRRERRRRRGQHHRRRARRGGEATLPSSVAAATRVAGAPVRRSADRRRDRGRRAGAGRGHHRDHGMDAGAPRRRPPRRCRRHRSLRVAAGRCVGARPIAVRAPSAGIASPRSYYVGTRTADRVDAVVSRASRRRARGGTPTVDVETNIRRRAAVRGDAGQPADATGSSPTRPRRASSSPGSAPTGPSRRAPPRRRPPRPPRRRRRRRARWSRRRRPRPHHERAVGAGAAGAAASSASGSSPSSSPAAATCSLALVRRARRSRPTSGASSPCCSASTSSRTSRCAGSRRAPTRTLLPLAALLNGIGFVDASRASTATRRTQVAPSQAVWTAVGVAAFVVTLVVVRNVRTLERYRYTFLFLGVVALLLPLVPGPRAGRSTAPASGCGSARSTSSPARSPRCCS